MKFIKKTIKWIVCILLIPIVYVLISFICTAITVNGETPQETPHTIYLSTNGVHLDIVISKNNLQEKLRKQLQEKLDDVSYISFGWGDENFYLNTPTWEDLTFSNAFSAMFLKSNTLMHVTTHEVRRNSWVVIQVSEEQLTRLNLFISETFQQDKKRNSVKLLEKSYGNFDSFYKANGSYSCFKTCNTWVNQALKESKIKACLWTLFDDGLLNKHRK
ncbi:DUF2459 domain-containing protein [Kordia algicida OT-1]|uniref:DUF2459 domain-containing protein n=1 Tax=Kordia algicida OT-1 TaxID=391587 RepID=A9DMF6_9FLAO|nr:DUF2459 domain-containing protein [Kordia algicida]EDP97694.1 hypothetical protein KAOT1_21067 [Kordia algicida OT-1]